MSALKVLDLFSGIGGLTMPLNRCILLFLLLGSMHDNIQVHSVRRGF